MQHLHPLSQTSQLNLKPQITQNTHQFHHKYYLGKPKIHQIKSFIQFHHIHLLLTNDQLTTPHSKT
ncbi:HflX-like GTP-binding protein, partial [Staphylococcus epidermidis]